MFHSNESMDMKKCITKIAVFFLIIVSIDIVFGYAMDYLFKNAKSGATVKNSYIASGTNEDILIFGSSRAVHHYMPDIIEDSLSMSCFNCGYDGQGILLLNGYLQMICQRYIPKVIVYDVQPHFDITTGDNVKYFRNLRPYFRKHVIREYIKELDRVEYIKDYSSLYRYNGVAVQTFLDYIRNRPIPSKGFSPSEGSMIKEPELDDAPDDNMDKIDSLKLQKFQEFIDLCKSKGIKLVFVISPLYKRTNSIEYEPLKQLAKRNDIIMIDNSKFDGLNNIQDYFTDGVHLSEEGSKLYSLSFAHQLKEILGYDK